MAAVVADAAVVMSAAHAFLYLYFAEAQPPHDFADGPRCAFFAVQLVCTFDQAAAGVVAFGQPVAVFAQQAAAFGQEFEMLGGDQID